MAMNKQEQKKNKLLEKILFFEKLLQEFGKWTEKDIQNKLTFHA